MLIRLRCDRQSMRKQARKRRLYGEIMTRTAWPFFAPTLEPRCRNLPTSRLSNVVNHARVAFRPGVNQSPKQGLDCRGTSEPGRLGCSYEATDRQPSLLRCCASRVRVHQTYVVPVHDGWGKLTMKAFTRLRGPVGLRPGPSSAGFPWQRCRAPPAAADHRHSCQYGP